MKTRTRILFAVSLLGNLFCALLLLCFVYSKGGSSYLTEQLGLSTPPRLVHYSKHHFSRRSLFQALPPTTGKTVLFGDSLIEYCEWEELLGKTNTVNRGIGGDRTESLLLRLDETVAAKPARLIIMAGSNDLHDGVPLYEIYGNFAELVRRTLAAAPGTKICIQSIPPVNNTLYGNKIRNKDVADLNDRLEQLCDSSGLTFVDLYAVLISNDGQLKQEYTLDGLHLKGDAYALWKQQIERLLE